MTSTRTTEAPEIIELNAPHRIAWTFAGELFRFELRAEKRGCLLVFTHVFDDRTLVAQTAAGWEAYLSRLEPHLAGHPLSEEEAHEPWAELHELYAQRLGIDPTAGRRFIATQRHPALALEDGPTLRLERRYRHDPERLWSALTDPQELAHWFPSGEPMTVVETVVPRLLVATWFGDTLRFELRPDGGGCVLVFTHAFEDPDTAARTAAGWDRSFARLDGLLAGTPIDERAALELWPEIHERYAESFGVDPELGQRSYLQHPLT